MIWFSFIAFYSVCNISSLFLMDICLSHEINFLPFMVTKNHSNCLKFATSLRWCLTCFMAITNGLVFFLSVRSSSIMSRLKQYACCFMFFLNEFSVTYILIRFTIASCMISHCWATSDLKFNRLNEEDLLSDLGLCIICLMTFLYAHWNSLKSQYSSLLLLNPNHLLISLFALSHHTCVFVLVYI